MRLTLFENGTYRLVEDYREEKDGHFLTKGSFVWEKGGSVISLIDKDGKRRFFVGENFLEMLGPNQKSPTASEEYLLLKVAEEVGPKPGEEGSIDFWEDTTRQELRVSAMTLERASSGDAGHVKFKAMLNFMEPAEGGHKSFYALYDLNCRAGNYTMRDVEYFSERNGKGNLIYSARNDRADPLFVESKRDILWQAFERFCPSRAAASGGKGLRFPLAPALSFLP